MSPMVKNSNRKKNKHFELINDDFKNEKKMTNLLAQLTKILNMIKKIF